jgi:RNA polymerase sigma factor for flagellar operon FliA
MARAQETGKAKSGKGAQDGLTEQGAAELWSRYKQDRSPATREKLILHYSPLVKYVAGRVSSGLPPSVEFGDLVSYGVFGLLDAIDKYDPGRGIKFETYAIARIKGAIIDELRADDWVPRSVRFKAREIERAYVSLEGELRRIPTDEEVAEKLGVTLDEYLGLLSKMSLISLVALDELWTVSGDRPDKISLADTVEDVKVKDVRDRGDEGHDRRCDQPAPRARAHSGKPVLLRGPDDARDRRGPVRHRVPRLPDAHQGDPQAQGEARKRHGLRLRLRPWG